MLMDIITGFNQFVCGLFGHEDMLRERDEQGHLGLRCMNCLKLMPNTFESLGVAPANPNYKPGKTGKVQFKTEVA